jgi:serine phosphatase RsbU (regulator of sigma subunit)
MTHSTWYFFAEQPPSYEGPLASFLKEEGYTVVQAPLPTRQHLEAFQSHQIQWLVTTPSALHVLLNAEETNLQSRASALKVNQSTYAEGDLLLQAPSVCEDVTQTLKQWKAHPATSSIHLLLWVEEAPNAQTLKTWHHLGVRACLLANQSWALTHAQLVSLVFQEKRQEALQSSHDEWQSLSKELTTRSVELEKELEKTKQLQLSLLPADIGAQQGANYNPFAYSKLHYTSDMVQVHGLYLPCEAIGGDLYDLITFKDKTLGILMSDVSGHGLPAAFITAMIKSSFYRITHHHQSPDQVLFHLNNQLADVVKTGDYSTALYLHLDEVHKTIQFAGAGHPYPYHYEAKTGEIHRLAENGTPLVWIPNIPYAMQERTLEAGDKILLFTDGISELQNPEDEMLGEDRLGDLLKSVIDEGATGADLLDSMLGVLSDFTQGHPLGDDMTMLLLEMK